MMMMQDFRAPFCCSKFPWARGRISPKIINNLGKRVQKGSLAIRRRCLERLIRTG
jgi:hypothetical protein